MTGWDNLADVRGKFLETIVMYDKKPVYVKAANTKEGDPNSFTLTIAGPGAARGKIVTLDDPALNYIDFNIGYVNHSQIATYWYRHPVKQYHQGLRGEQMGWHCSMKGMHPDNGFGMHKPFLAMLEGTYPDNEAVEKALKEGTVKLQAFHRDFACAWDSLHEDCVLEYRGVPIGVARGSGLTEFKVQKAHSHLTEALREAVSGV